MKSGIRTQAAVFAAGMLAAAAAWPASTVPSIEITGISSNGGGCSTPGVTVNVNNNLPSGGLHSDNFEIYDGSTLLYRWIGESYDSVSPGTYGINSAPASVPADTIVTGVIYTFAASSNPPPPYTSAVYSYRSEVQWNCTTGALVSITNSIGGTPVVVATPVPTLQQAALAMLALLLGAAGWFVRRRDRA